MKRLMRYGLGEYPRILRRLCLCGVSILRGNAALYVLSCFTIRYGIG